MEFGFDIHGVIDSKPKFFSEVTQLLSEDGHGVHILTGSPETINLRKELNYYGVRYKKIFSITDHLVKSGAEVTFDSKGKPHADEILWNKAKGFYSKENNLAFHVDDTLRYRDYFETPFAYFDLKNLVFYWTYKEIGIGEFMYLTPTNMKNIIIAIGESFNFNEEKL